MAPSESTTTGAPHLLGAGGPLDERTRAARARRVLVGTFLLFTLLDVFSWRALVFTHVADDSSVSKVVFERHDDRDGELIASLEPWQYPMLPQPAFKDDATLSVPPGYPIALSRSSVNRAISLDLYETRTPPMLLVDQTLDSDRGETVVARPDARALAFLTVDVEGSPIFRPVAREPPRIDEILAISACFADDDALRFDVTLDANVTVVGGRCTWSVPSPTGRIVVDSPDSSMVVMGVDGSRFAGGSLRWWLLALLVVLSLVHRAAFLSPRHLGTDGTAVVAVLAASFVAPVWIVLWGAKCAVGLLFGLVALIRTAIARPRLRAPLAALAVVALALPFVVDPLALARANNRFNQRGKASVDTSVSPPSETAHLVLGASMVNGAALARGAYGDGALDQVLARTCGAPDRVTARHAIDGGSACFLRDTWRDTALALPSLTHRTFFGGFNDDMTAPASSAGVWLSTIVGVLPSHDPRPRAHAVWQMAAEANLRPDRQAAMMECLTGVAADVPSAPLVHVYELGTFDLGHPRRFGREAWTNVRQDAVARAGGRFIDIRALLPGESPMYFNDFSHLSEIGYAAVAREICKDDGATGLRGDATETPGGCH